MTLWIVSALYGGYTASNILKWYWWRLNGYGYFWGMISGIAGSMIVPLTFPSITPIMVFPYVFLISLIGCILGSLFTEPEEDAILMKFYMQVHPWGFWKPIIEKVHRYYPSFEKNHNFFNDLFNIVVGVVWQLCLVLLPISFITQEYHFLYGVIIMSCPDFHRVKIHMVEQARRIQQGDTSRRFRRTDENRPFSCGSSCRSERGTINGCIKKENKAAKDSI